MSEQCITMTQFRQRPGYYTFRVSEDGHSFIVTSQGKPVFRIIPVQAETVVHPDGSFTGPRPILMGENL